MAQALEAAGRGSETVKALRLAQSLQPRDDTADYLATAAAQYGLRPGQVQRRHSSSHSSSAPPPAP